MRVLTTGPYFVHAAVRGLGALALANLVAPRALKYPAGCAALAVGAGAEDRLLGSALGGLATLSALVRVRRGTDSPAAVLAGTGVGVLAAATLNHIIPPATDQGATFTEAPIEQVQACPDGSGLVVVADPKSDSGRGDRDIAPIRAGLPAARIVRLQQGEDHESVMRQVATEADVLGIAGGDGTVSTAAKVALSMGKRLAVFPAGTFNHFAKTIGCRSPEDTIRAVREGTVQKVDVARLNNDVVVINTASVGAYPQFVKIRERHQNKVGKPLAAVYAALKVLRHERTVTIGYDGNTAETALFFLGNSVYVPSGFVPEFRPRMDDGLLDIRFVEVGKPWARTRVIAALLCGTLARCPLYHEFHVPDFRMTVESGPTPVAHDGDLLPAMQQLEFESLYRVLPVYRPA